MFLIFFFLIVKIHFFTWIHKRIVGLNRESKKKTNMEDFLKILMTSKQILNKTLSAEIEYLKLQKTFLYLDA